MSSQPENQFLVDLLRMDEKIDDIRDDRRDVKERLSLVEFELAVLLTEFTAFWFRYFCLPPHPRQNLSFQQPLRHRRVALRHSA